jgi:hypothetical protein
MESKDTWYTINHELKYIAEAVVEISFLQISTQKGSTQQSTYSVAERSFLARVMYHISHTTEYGGARNVMHVGTDNVHQALLTKYIKWSTIIIKIVKCDNKFSLKNLKHHLRYENYVTTFLCEINS